MAEFHFHNDNVELPDGASEVNGGTSFGNVASEAEDISGAPVGVGSFKFHDVAEMNQLAGTTGELDADAVGSETTDMGGLVERVWEVAAAAIQSVGSRRGRTERTETHRRAN